ncbi:Phosphoglycolate phosphatase, HAD superfamily [Micromonospora phaseoli]|uniref:Phosphoglycolate phosphatase, HAD superfamily n=1 Tax=Micromonospora phaseoli TaxID=1144548 RepID=A0A1H6XCG6_9ACTN|nr:HAD hydrolase-like protein [Micromonospora phaseoli]PZW02195.1 phosphoglycolate phosphatase-like HAD superfamily hydrolase [Micromonospora phaseoli]GIJ75803.1 phosphatase [Micromonospora phaseoli]SEJ26818.1 Phosphoglycolate phosphatase, HAD superfamily [Micromonospora phaseoli]
MTPARTHLVWDWNGTLLNDLDLVVACTNAVFASEGGPTVTADEHRVRFRRPIADYYAEVLGRAVDDEAFGRLDRVFHDAYRVGLTTCELAHDAVDAMSAWPGTQSLLSMWFHDELVPAVRTYGLAGRFARVDGLRAQVGGDRKAESLARHLDELGVDGRSVVLIGDSIDDADAALSVGGRAVLYAGGFTDQARLEASGHPVAETLTKAVHLALTFPLTPSPPATSR